VKSSGFYGASFSKFIIMTEVWKDIEGYEGYYQVSNLGRVKSLKWNKERILKPFVDSSKYQRVKLSSNLKEKNFLVHRLVAIAFITDGREQFVNHIDGDKLNNNLLNLEWVNKSENVHHYKLKQQRALPVNIHYNKAKNKFEYYYSCDNKKLINGYCNTKVEAEEKLKDFFVKNKIKNKYFNLIQNGKNEISI